MARTARTVHGGVDMTSNDALHRLRDITESLAEEFRGYKSDVDPLGNNRYWDGAGDSMENIMMMIDSYLDQVFDE